MTEGIKLPLVVSACHAGSAIAGICVLSGSLITASVCAERTEFIAEARAVWLKKAEADEQNYMRRRSLTRQRSCGCSDLLCLHSVNLSSVKAETYTCRCRRDVASIEVEIWRLTIYVNFGVTAQI
jgi:hypothetical protein